MKPKPDSLNNGAYAGHDVPGVVLPRLSARLECVKSLVPSGGTIADIGTDHAYLAVNLLNGIADRVIASDINPGPLASARATAEKYNVSDKIEFCLSPGFEKLDIPSIDTAVIAGMGGETIISILDYLQDEDLRRITFVLQPQTKQFELYEYLASRGIGIEDAELCRDGAHDYIALRAKYGPGEAVPFSMILSRDSLQAADYLRRQCDYLRSELSGHERSGRIERAGLVRARIKLMEDCLNKGQ